MSKEEWQRIGGDPPLLVFYWMLKVKQVLFASSLGARESLIVDSRA